MEERALIVSVYFHWPPELQTAWRPFLTWPFHHQSKGPSTQQTAVVRQSLVEDLFLS